MIEIFEFEKLKCLICRHGNRLVRAEACQLLARVVDKLGVGGTLNLPVDSRDAVITAATNMVFDNTPTSR